MRNDGPPGTRREGRDDGLLRYHLRCRRDDLRAELPRRTRRIALGAALTVAVAAVAVALGGSWSSVLGVTFIFAMPVAVAGGVLLRARRQLRRLETRLDDEDPEATLR